MASVKSLSDETDEPRPRVRRVAPSLDPIAGVGACFASSAAVSVRPC